MSDKLPPRGIVIWPVGTGDSIAIIVREDETIVQVDLHDISGDDSEKYTPIVERLEALLPKRNGRPYLSCFVLTHPDKDHITGFEQLMEKVDIDEIWHTPRIFRQYEQENDLCDDAKVFCEECTRRRKVTIQQKGDVEVGDRVRIFGHDALFEEDEYKNFPTRWRGFPGKSVTELDGEDLSAHFEAFVHAPFKDTCEEDRNNSSLALQVTLLSDDGTPLKVLLFGDLSYPTLKRIVEKTREKENDRYLEWHVCLSPHHCSKYAMYQRVDGEDVLQKDPEILKEFEKEKLSPAYVVASCDLPFTDKSGSNPPHSKARRRYEEIVDNGHFLCTHEHGDKQKPERIEFTLDDDGVHYKELEGSSESGSRSSNGESKKRIGEAASELARRSTPTVHTGYGTQPEAHSSNDK